MPGPPKTPLVRRRRRPQQLFSSLAKVQEMFVFSFPYISPFSMQVSTETNHPPLAQIIGPHLYTTSEAPLYHRGLVSNLCLFIILLVFIGLTIIYLMFRNRQHAARREELGKSAVIIDRSMMTARERAADTGAVGEIEGYEGEKAFDDITDLKNEDFVYIY
jgi:hypothetical protein